MAYLLRGVRKAKWLKHENVSWLDAGDLQADALTDLKTENNTLSVWIVENEASIHRVITALAATRDEPANFDYALLDLSAVTSLHLRWHEKIGETPDVVVNAWYRDLPELSTRKLVGLAHAIHEFGQIERLARDHIVRLITDGITAKHIDPSRMNEKLRLKLSSP